MSTHQTPNPSFRTGADALRGGLDITISLTPGEAAALGEAETLSDWSDWFDTALWALTLLRNGHNERAEEPLDVTPTMLYTVINDLDNRLLPRLQGIRDAAVRRHQELGGTLTDLALAMDVPKSTAQSRRNVVTNRQPTSWERWAIAGGPQGREHCKACGHPARPSDPIVTTADDDAFRIHRSHVTSPRSGFFGTPTDDGLSPYTTGTRVAGGFVIGQQVRITGVSGPLAARTDLIGKLGEVTAEARDGSINLRGLSGKPRSEEVFADILGFLTTELEPTEPTRN